LFSFWNCTLHFIDWTTIDLFGHKKYRPGRITGNNNMIFSNKGENKNKEANKANKQRQDYTQKTKMKKTKTKTKCFKPSRFPPIALRVKMYVFVFCFFVVVFFCVCVLFEIAHVAILCVSAFVFALTLS
jgi:Flp pilus assembly protein TadB